MSVSLSLFPPRSVLFTSHSEQILRQAVWCSKQKGLKAFHQPPRLKTSPFKGKHKLAQEKLFTLDTNMGRLLPTDVANSLQIIQFAWNCRVSTCWDEDNFAEGQRLIIMQNLHFAFCALKSLLIFTLYLSNWTRDWKGALQLCFTGVTISSKPHANISHKCSEYGAVYVSIVDKRTT